MPLTILSSAQLHSLLLSLTRDDIIQLQHNLADALREYSTGNQEEGCAATYQPQRTAITRRNGCTTLFMPASTGQTLGIKAISLQDGGNAGCSVGTDSSLHDGRRRSGVRARDSITSFSSEASDHSAGSSQGEDVSSSAISSNGSSSGPFSSGCVNGQSVTFGLSATMGAWPGPGMRDTSPRGSVTLLDSNSLPFGLINAQELTAFRTALASVMIFNKRKRVRTLTVFGAGNQAYWHIRLALTLRGAEIKRVNILNRSFDRAAELLKNIYSPENASWRQDVKFSAVSSDFVEYSRILKEAVRKADVIFCCTPSVEPLFPAPFLTTLSGRQKGRFVCAVGSYKPHMTELHPDILREEVKPDAHHRHFHKHTKRSGVVVVDSLEAALKEAGEIVQADIKPDQVVEVGELLIAKQTSLQAAGADSAEEKTFREWLERGNVIYKSVGLGLMDLVTGGDLVRLARERNVGLTVDDF